MKPLNPPSRCLSLSCLRDGQEYWIVLLETGLWQRDVGSSWHSFVCAFLKAGESFFPCQAFEAGLHELLWFFTAVIPAAFPPAWVFLCPTLSWPWLVFLTVSLIQSVSAPSAYSCHLVPIPAGGHVQSQHLTVQVIHIAAIEIITRCFPQHKGQIFRVMHCFSSVWLWLILV